MDKLSQTSELYTLPQQKSTTAVRFKRAGLEGKIVGYEEYSLPSDTSTETSKNSLSVNRQTGSKLDFVRGHAGFMPFTPGGLEVSDSPVNKLNLHRDTQGLFDIPPGFPRGFVEEEVEEAEDMAFDELLDEETPEAGEEEEEEVQLIDRMQDLQLDSSKVHSAMLDDLLPNEMTFGRVQTDALEKIPKVKEWAHIVDVNKQINNFHELVPSLAKEWPFELDTFQKEAVYHLEQGDSVFVAAHTSAGKTVVAEYAIAMATRNMTKAIYTSPIKALSNQKFRDFKEVFDDVGILTGDVQINPEANCLIMTTEILRSMLYRGADLIRDVEFVIFDEVHYVNDQDRGVVWEEVIIMLPDHIKLILLSATVPNTYEFANWVGRTKQRDIYVISTPKRPVPLEHFLWASDNMYKIVDANKKFIEQGYSQAQQAVAPPAGAPSGPRGGGQAGRGGRGGTDRGGSARGGRGGGGGRGRGGARGGGNTAAYIPAGQNGRRFNNNTFGKRVFLKLCQHLKKNNLLPAVIFVFSQKKCAQYADMLGSIDYCTAKEKSEIHMFIDKAVARLKKEDRDLPQIHVIRELLSRGIGIHHGGLLPIVKETIEILFAKSLVKVLFATETFAMGLNLPTKTVIFASVRKHDGRSFRTLLPGEYTQMAGRAGRRGLDPTGTVMIMVDSEIPASSSFRELILGNPTKLHSQFRLTYNMILNLLRIEALRVEEMIKRSFSENANQVMLPEHQKNVAINQETLAKLKRAPCSMCDVDMNKVLLAIVRERELHQEILHDVMRTPIGRFVLTSGRIVLYKVDKKPRALAVVVRVDDRKQLHLLTFTKVRDTSQKSEAIPFYSMIEGYGQRHMNQYFSMLTPFTFSVVPLSAIEMVTRIKVKADPSALLHGSSMEVNEVLKELRVALKYQNKLNETSWSGIKSAAIKFKLDERNKLMEQIRTSKCIECPTFATSFKMDYEAYMIKRNIENLQQLISSENMDLLPDYEQRIEVLKELNYIDKDQNVLLKGRVACEVSSGYELIITELVLDNFLASYEPEEIVALLSAFLFNGNSQSEVRSITPSLDFGKERITEVVTKVLNVFEAHNVLVTQEESEFLEKNRFGLMEAVYEWGRGLSFKNIMDLTDVAEGTIVRVISRLDEVCREVMAAARIIGDATLYDKMALAQEKIKRDIVFCASLYL